MPTSRLERDLQARHREEVGQSCAVKVPEVSRYPFLYSSEAHIKREMQIPLLLGISPHTRHIRLYQIRRVGALSLAVLHRRRPGFEVAEEILHVPPHVCPEGWCLYGLKREGKVVELVYDVVQALVPVILENLLCQMLDDGVDVVAKHRGVVRPSGHDPARLHDAAHLQIEPVQAEPVDRGS